MAGTGCLTDLSLEDPEWEIHHEIIKLHCKTMTKNLTVRASLLSELYSESLISAEDQESLGKETMTNAQKVSQILQSIQRQGPRSMKPFLNALKETTGERYMAKKIRATIKERAKEQLAQAENSQNLAKYDEAVGYHTITLHLFKDADCTQETVECLCQLAIDHFSLNNDAQAQSNIEEALEVVREKEVNSQQNIKINLALGSVYSISTIDGREEEGKIKAREFYTTARNMCKNLSGGQDDTALAHYLMACDYSDLRQGAEALDHAKQSLAIREELYPTGRAVELAQSHNILSMSYKRGRMNEKAAEHAKKAREICSKLPPNCPKTKLAKGDSHRFLGYAYQASKKHCESIVELGEAARLYKEVFEERDHPNLAKCYYSMAMSHQYQQNHAEALECDVKALEMRQRLYKGKCHKDIAYSMRNLASDQGKLNNFPEAFEYEEQAHDMYCKLYKGSNKNIAATLQNMGNHCTKMQEFEKGLVYYEEAKQMYNCLYGQDNIYTACLLDCMSIAMQLYSDFYKVKSEEMRKRIKEKGVQ